MIRVIRSRSQKCPKCKFFAAVNLALGVFEVHVFRSKTCAGSGTTAVQT